MNKTPKHILDLPSFYRFFQNLVKTRKKSFYHALAEFLDLKFPKHQIIDVGCGDAKFAEYLDSSRDYLGLDFNAKYIEKAQKTYPHFKFKTADVSEVEVKTGEVVFLLIGVVHHLDDSQTLSLINAIKEKNPQASIICFDGLRKVDQDPIAKFLKDLDRGKFVRYLEGYQKVLPGFNFAFRSDLLNLPYDHIISAYNCLAEEICSHLD